MTVFAQSCASLADHMAHEGMDAEQAFAKENIPLSRVANPAERIPVEAIDRILSAAVAESGDPSFAMREADHFRPGHLGPLGFAWLASPTLRSALQRLERFSRVVDENLSLEWRVVGDEAWVALEWSVPAVDELTREDQALAAMVAMIHWLCGENLTPSRARVKHPEPDPRPDYEARLRCPIAFDQEMTALAIPVDALDIHRNAGNEQIAALNDQVAIRYLASLDRHDTAGRVRSWIMESLSEGDVTELAAAEAMACSPRQLHRKLADQDTSFKTLLNETRQELAEQLIADPTLSLTEVSFMLGFSETSSFSRAFKRWTGMPPSKAREQQSS